MFVKYVHVQSIVISHATIAIIQKQLYTNIYATFFGIVRFNCLYCFESRLTIFHWYLDVAILFERHHFRWSGSRIRPLFGFNELWGEDLGTHGFIWKIVLLSRLLRRAKVLWTHISIPHRITLKFAFKFLLLQRHFISGSLNLPNKTFSPIIFLESFCLNSFSSNNAQQRY